MSGDVDSRAEALAEVFAEFLERVAVEDAKEDAYWLLEALENPAGEVGRWNMADEREKLEKAIDHLARAEFALRGLAPELQVALSRSTKIRRGLVIPDGAADALAARSMRLQFVEDKPPSTPKESGNHSRDVTVQIGTLSSSAPGVLRELIMRLRASKPMLLRAMERGESPGGSNWPAVIAYKSLEIVWERHKGQQPPRFPKDNHPFYEFAERAFEALDIRGQCSSPASVRSAYDALRKLEKKSSST